MAHPIRTVALSVVIILVGIGGFLAFKATKPVPPQKPAKTSGPLVRVVVAKKQDIRVSVEESGNVEPKTTLEIIPEVSGRIVKTSPHLRAGYFLSKGELLIEIDPREYRLNVVQFEAQMAQLEAEMAKTDQERENILLHLKVEQEKLKFASAELERKKKLFASGSISQSDMDKQEIEHDRMETSYLTQKNALALIKSQKDLIKAKVEATKAQLETARIKLEKTKIFAPFNARVTQESVEVGQYVQIGQKLASIFDISAMEIVLNLPTDKMIHLEFQGRISEASSDFENIFKNVADANEFIKRYGPEAEVTYRWPRGVRTWKGKVTRLKGQLDVATRTVPLVIEVKDPFKDVIPGKTPPLVPGMYVTVTLSGKLYKQVVKIPRAAVHGENVYIADKGKLAIRKVKVVRLGDGFAYVSKGLNSGDRVIVSPIPIPIPGQPVRTAVSRQESGGQKASQ